jgi:hypothetical protein
MDDEAAVDELGPVDYIVVEFPGSKFNGEIAPALAELVEQGTIRVLAMLLSEDDVAAVAEALEPGSSAAVLVWENIWAAPFASAVRKSGGQLVASGRIPIQAILAAIEADEAEEVGA